MLVEKVAIHLIKETIKLNKLNKRRTMIDIKDTGTHLEVRLKYLNKMYGTSFKYEQGGYDRRYMLDKYIEAGFNYRNLHLRDTEITEDMANKVKQIQKDKKKNKLLGSILSESLKKQSNKQQKKNKL